MTRALKAALSMAILGCAAPTPMENRRGWVEVRTPHFTLTGQVSTQESVSLAVKLELFRSAVVKFLRLRRVDPTIPMQIYVFSGLSSLAPFLAGDHVIAFFLPGMRANVAAIARTGRRDAASLLYHEYTHFLQSNASDAAFPRWFSEGYAEFMGALRVRGGRLEIGGIQKKHERLRSSSAWVPIRRVLSAERYDTWTPQDRAMFYAEAWGLVHYLMSSADRKESFVARMSVYLDASSDGRSVKEALERAWGMSPRRLDRLSGATSREGFTPPRCP